MRRLSRLLFAVALVVLPIEAFASGFLVARYGEHGHPTTYNPTAIYFNPAGMSLRGGTRLYVEGIFAWRSFTYDRDAGAIDDIIPADGQGVGTPEGEGVSVNSGEARMFNVLANPFLGFVTDFGVEGLGFGVGAYVPFGGTSGWDNAESSSTYPGAVDGPQRWWIIEGSIRSIYATLAASYQIKPIRLSVGAGFNLVFSSVNTVRARNTDGTDHLVQGNGLQEGRGLIDVSGINASFTAGLVWEPIDHLFIGLSYQAQPGMGTMKMDGQLTQLLGAAPESQKNDIEFRQALPDVFRLGIRYTQPKEWEVRLGAELVRWSHFDRQCLISTSSTDADPNPERNCSFSDGSPNVLINIPRLWEDAIGVKVGGSYWLGEETQLDFGLSYDGNAVPDSTVETSLYDDDKISIAVGARFALLEETLYLGASYTQIIYFGRDIAPRDKITRSDGTTISDYTGATGVSDKVRQPDSAGTYSHSIGVLDVNLEFIF